jgi:uncharacterized protein
MAKPPFLGKSLTFPIDGKFIPTSGVALVLQDIEAMLLTNFGERVMRPEFGGNVSARVWENLDSAAQNALISIRTAIVTYEPRVILLDVTPVIKRSEGIVYFHIRMLIREGNIPANLVFPFKPVSEISQR